MNTRRLILPVALLLAAGAARAEFDDLGTSARIVGLGGAGVAFADDASALFLHPAGLTRTRNPGLVTGYRRLETGLTDGSVLWDGFAAYGHALGPRWGTLAAGWQGFGLKEAYMEQTWALGYGRLLPERWGLIWSAGAAGLYRQKSIERDAYTDADPLFQANGGNRSAFDLSAGLGVERGALHAGFVWDRILRPSLSLDPGAERLPTRVSGGVSYAASRVSVGADLGLQGRDVTGKTGVEFALVPDRLNLRGGLGIGSRRFAQVSAGVGILVRGYRLDYAAVFPLTGLRETHYTHYVSVLVPFSGLWGSSTAALPGVYVVKPGDTLPSVAAKPEIYGDATRWREIHEANRGILGGSFELYPGVRLVIPRPATR